MKTFLISTASVAAITLATGAYAQTPAAGTAPATVETVTVTGTAIRGVAPIGSAVVSVSHADLLQQGSINPADVVQDLPQGSSLGIQQNSGGNNTGRGQGVNLRGLGNNATLVLFDGHRLVGQGIIAQFADPNQLPVSAIQRVEIVTDGASAIYGSDAVAGVVNYILRRDYTGAELTVRHASSLYDDVSFDGLAGKSWDIGDVGSGNIMVGGVFSHTGSFLNDARAYLMDNLTPYGGNDNRYLTNGTATVPGAVPNILVNNVVYGLPSTVTNGVTPTAAQVIPLKTKPNLADSGDYTMFQPINKRFSVVGRLTQDIGDKATVSLTSIYSRRDSHTNDYNTLSIQVAPDSQYYIKGLTALPTDNEFIQYNLNINKGTKRTTTFQQDISWNTTLDASYKLGGDWEITGYGTYGRNKGTGQNGDRTNSSYINVSTEPAYAATFNPYLQGPQPQFLNLAIGGSFQVGHFEFVDFVGKVDGSLFSLPAGDVRVAVGAEHNLQRETLVLTGTNRDIAGTFVTFRNTQAKRTVFSAFGEVYVPLFSSENAIPLVQSLNFNAALRYDQYSDFGGTTNPKFGFDWVPFDEVTVRGSWGTSFRAPTLVEDNPGVLEQINRANFTNRAGDTSIPLTNVAQGTSAVISRIGNTPGLQPESATVWSAGFDYSPGFLDGFKLSITYYNVAYQNRIENVPSLTSALSSPANRALYAPFILVAPQPKTCVNGNYATYNPIYLPYVNSPNNFTSTTIPDCTLTAIVLGGERNLGTLDQDGLDFAATYRFDTDFGNFNLNANFATILKLNKSFLPGGPLNSELNAIGFQNGLRFTARANWSDGPYAAGVSTTYIGPYLNNLPITVAGVVQPNQNVPAWDTIGFNATYTVPDLDGYYDVLSRMRLALIVDNIFDKQPPIVLSGTSAVDVTSGANVFGRIVTLSITKYL